MGSSDVVVVGGGIAGVSVAYELAAHRSVVLVEAEPQLGRHATARSAATWVPGHGAADVRRLVAASGPRFGLLEQELGTPPLLRPRPVLFVGVDDVGERALAAHLAERAGEQDAPQEIDGPAAVRLCPALAPGVVRRAGIVDGADVDTDALHQGYLRGLRRRGGTVLADAPVSRIERVGARWQVHAGGEVLDTALVVDAAGAWADVVARAAGVRELGLDVLRRTIASVRVPDPARLRTPDGGPLPFVVDPADRFYFKADGDDLLCSPADETPTGPGDARPDPLDVASALERVEAVTRLGLRSVRTSWAGLRTFAADRRPVVGSWPDDPGFAFVAAQGGSGIETAPALSVFAAAVLIGTAPPADLGLAASAFVPGR